ncbi:hypothetical protein JCM6882_001595 [Rhodosporidiobolus microsporus]
MATQRPSYRERDNRLASLYGTVQRAATGRNFNAPALDVVKKWCSDTRAMLKDSCLGWSKTEVERFQSLCVEEGAKLRTLTSTATPAAVTACLTSPADFVATLDSQTPLQHPPAPPAPPAHPSSSRRSRSPSHVPLFRFNLPLPDPSHSPGLPPVFDPHNFDSDGEEILDNDPFRMHSLARSPAVTDRTAQRYGYRSAGHWRAAQRW